MSRRLARVHGIVQGVGFRPFVARLSADLGLAGSVRNEGAAVRIEVEGARDRLDAFAHRLCTEAPLPARVDGVVWTEIPPVGLGGFAIEGSEAGPPRLAVPPDLATCPECLAEVRDPVTRRAGYPFTNCTRCGPRYSVVAALPWDRARTSMASFPMCGACAREYADPSDRRHHAEPIACPACGPRCWLVDARGAPIATGPDALAAARECLRRGDILALKGLGGWQILADARDEAAVRRLRERKRREAKPFAVMVPDLAAARALAHVVDVSAHALEGPAAPVVLVPRRADARVADAVAPSLGRIGLLLPATPLHHLLVDGLGFPVVCTSGNLHDDPIVIDDDDACARLGSIADALLGHDRAILRRCDDSVVQVVAGRARVLRLGRGLAPTTLPLPPGPTLLCVGGHQKCAPVAAVGDEAVLWPHVGDLNGVSARDALVGSLAAMRTFLRFEPAAVVHDAHPDYASTRVARAMGLPCIAVQHHHAHVAAVLAEHGVDDALGVAWDGVGLGADGTAWGGEFLRVDPRGARRVAWLAPFPLPGGDAAARDGRRCLAGVLVAAGLDIPAPLAPFAAVARNPRLCAPTTSAGRLFDAVAALLSVRARSRFEGEAAMALEEVAMERFADSEAILCPFRLDGPVVDWRPMIAELLRESDTPRAAARFHATLVAMIVAVAEREGMRTVALSGGCFQNVRLAEATCAALSQRGFRPLLPTAVPPGDGGLALGQAWVARHGSTWIPSVGGG
ncbi:MAG: carbamoyltransferase HypF [Myxococcota bacterium]